MRKAVSLIVSLVLVLSLTAPAMAADPLTRLGFVRSVFGDVVSEQDAVIAAPFTDVNPQDALFVAAIVNAGIANGFGDGTFRPNASITSEQAVVMVIRYLTMGKGELELAMTTVPEDINVSGWALPYLAWAMENAVELVPSFDAGTRASSSLVELLRGMIPEMFTVENVLVNNGGHDIPAVVTMPTGAEGEMFPVVIMLHGTGSNKDEAGGGYLLLAPFLAKNGIGSIRFDFMGNGDSEADYIDYSFTTAVADANRMIEYAQELPNADPSAIGIMGWSQGGTIALLTAGVNDAVVSVVTWAGAPNLRYSSLFTEEGYAEALENGYSMLEFAWRDSLRLGLQWYEDVLNTDVLEVFSRSAAPVLAIIGGGDVVVEPETAGLIAGASSNEASEALVLEGVDHTFNIFSGDMTAFNRLSVLTLEWFADTLR